MSIFLVAMVCVFLTVVREQEQREPQPVPRQVMKGLSFMTGSWAMEQNGKRVEEHWTAPRGGMMLATAVTLCEERTVFFEFLRVEESAQGIFYHAQPRGLPTTAFKLVSVEHERAVF